MFQTRRYVCYKRRASECTREDLPFCRNWARTRPKPRVGLQAWNHQGLLLASVRLQRRISVSVYLVSPIWGDQSQFRSKIGTSTARFSSCSASWAKFGATCEKLTCWVRSENLSSLEQERDQAYQIDAPKQTIPRSTRPPLSLKT